MLLGQDVFRTRQVTDTKASDSVAAFLHCYIYCVYQCIDELHLCLLDNVLHLTTNENHSNILTKSLINAIQ